MYSAKIRAVLTIPAFLIAATTASLGQTLTTLVSFTGATGASPWAALIQGTNGDLYGTTVYGGTGGAFDGTVFKMTRSGILTTLHNECSQLACTDGEFPYGGLVQAADGAFYGMTNAGGSNDLGTVFKISPSGSFTTLHSFSGSDGAYPAFGALIQAMNGNFYGMTSYGGADNVGTVFTMTAAGTLTTLHSFTGASDGGYPQAGLVQGADGDFYGTTYDGGAHDCGDTGSFGGGTIFKITKSGTLTTLHSFGGVDGCNPYAALIQGTNGYFYGTTYAGGEYGYGSVFRMTPSGSIRTLHSFDNTDGAEPIAGLIQATDGSFYGTTMEGGVNYVGTVFRITPTGTLSTLHSFEGADGSNPYGGLVQDTSGSLLGTTQSGGVMNDGCEAGCGTVFRLNVGLGPFVKTFPVSGQVGAAVEILGTGLGSATEVNFNGTATAFKVISDSEIMTTVPLGATTGIVQVSTAGKNLSSNLPFLVRP